MILGLIKGYWMQISKLNMHLMLNISRLVGKLRRNLLAYFWSI